MDIKGQTAIVTGGGSGLGAEVGAQLARAGARVALLDINAEAVLARAAEFDCLGIQCDVADSISATAAVAKARKELDAARILVNCAGVGTAKRILGREGPMALADFERVIRVNLIGTFNMIRLAAAGMSTLPPLKDQERGVIISTASVAAYEGQVGQAAYSASKGGVASMTLPAARELAQYGIRVLAIAPGLFETPMMRALPLDIQESLGASVPFPKRLGKPSEFASLVLTCITNIGLNGEVIRLDGALRLPPR